VNFFRAVSLSSFSVSGSEKDIQLDQLKKDLAEMSIRLLALPANAPRDDRAVAEVERMANQVLREVAALRARETSGPGEKRGAWRAFKNTA